MGPKSCYNYLYKKEAEGDLTTEEEGHVTMEQNGRCAAGFEDGGRGHKPRDARDAALEPGKGQKTASPLEPPDLRPPECKMCCFKAPSLWSFVTVATGTMADTMSGW